MKDIKQKEEILKKRADVLRVPRKKIENLGEQMPGLAFMLADEKYVVASDFVSEVIEIDDLTPLPCTPAFILGIINVRGKILSLVDIKAFLNLPAKAVNKLIKVIVVKHEKIELGILADKIVGSILIKKNELQNYGEKPLETHGDFIKGLSPEGVILLDIKQLLQSEVLNIDEEA